MIKKTVSLMAALVVVVLGLAGCATTDSGAGTQLHIYLQENGQFKVQDRLTTLDKLPDRLKSAGANGSTAIMIHEPKGTTDEERKQIGSKLASGKFRRFTFVGPREIEARVVVETNRPALKQQPAVTTNKTTKATSTTKKKAK